MQRHPSCISFQGFLVLIFLVKKIFSFSKFSVAQPNSSFKNFCPNFVEYGQKWTCISFGESTLGLRGLTPEVLMINGLNNIFLACDALLLFMPYSSFLIIIFHILQRGGHGFPDLAVLKNPGPCKVKRMNAALW